MGHLIPEGLKEIRRKHERGKKGGREERRKKKGLSERRKRKLKRQEWNFEREGKRSSDTFLSEMGKQEQQQVDELCMDCSGQDYSRHRIHSSSLVRYTDIRSFRN